MRIAAVLVLVAACARPGASVDAATAPVDAAVADLDAPVLPADTVPCDHADAWPYALRSTAHPVLVHYRTPGERAMAEQVLALVDHSWDVEVGTLGFRPPIDDGALCGPDGAFDVFLWRGHEECFVDVIAENGATPYDDRAAYLVVDPWGPYGGAILDTTVAHELNHAMQAADDWDDSAIVYEMTSVFVEDLVYDDDNQYVNQIVDFQAHPDWSLDHDDQYVTWYMYGSALYLRFLRDRYFEGSGAFAGAMWKALRSPYGAGDPDFEDALDTLLAAKGTRFVDTIPEFERWRVYTGARDDGHHFREGATFAEPARLAAVPAGGASIDVAPMELGAVYVDVPAGHFSVSLTGASSEVAWDVQIVPDDPAVARTIVVTALPKGANDPESRSALHHHATLVVAP